MHIFHGLPPASQRTPVALTIGNFDGVHRGHRALFSRLTDAAARLGIEPAIMTFEPHPREYFAPAQAPARIANLRTKLASLRECGIARAFVMRFNARLAGLDAERFIDEILVQGLDVRHVLVGDDFRFGAGRAGDVRLLQERAQGRYEVAQMDTLATGAGRISSSAVRAALAQGDLDAAAALLGGPYTIAGRVVHGAKLGRQLGFPTLNLRLGRHAPACRGIFAVRVRGLAAAPLPGVASIGLRPTVDSSGRWLLEVNLFDFDRPVYGALVQVDLVGKLRDEVRYDTLDALSAAIARDAAAARAMLGAA